MHCGSGEAAEHYAAQGFRLVTVGVDTSLFKATIGRELERRAGGVAACRTHRIWSAARSTAATSCTS